MRRAFVIVLVIASCATDVSGGAGNKCVELKDPDQRITACTRLIKRFKREERSAKTVSAAYVMRGVGYFSKGDWARAIADFDEAIRLHPYVDAYSNRGTAYYKKNEYDRAIADYTKAIALNTKDASVYIQRAATFEKKDEVERAIADYSRR